MKNMRIQQATDFTSNIQKIIELKARLFICRLGRCELTVEANCGYEVQDQGIKISTGAPDIAGTSNMEPLVGMEGFSVYYHDLPKNEVNDWLVEEHKKRFKVTVPDLFTAGGMSAAISIVEALKKQKVIQMRIHLMKNMEGMSFETPKGK